jgi:hypothetical protein
MTSLFLNPFLWPFLLAASVPILLHLLSLRRLPVVDLSTFRFLFDTYVQQRRRLRLLEYLLLFLRVLFLLLLVLALMRPTQSNWSSLFGLGGGRSVSLIVDCSASMNAQTAGVSSVDRAKEAAVAVLDQLSKSDRVTLVRLVQRPEIVLSQFAADSSELRTAVANLAPGFAVGNVHAAISTAMAEERRGGRSIYLVTDLQRTGWKQVLDQPAGAAFGDDRLFVVNVGAGDRLTNTAVVGDAPTETDAIVGQPVELRPRVGNFGDRPMEVALRVEVDGRQVARYSLSIPPGKTTTRTVTYVPTKSGPLRGSYKIDRDPFDADDEFQFVLNVARPVRVLLINGKPDADPFKDELVFLRAALQSRFSEGDDPALSDGAGLRTLDALSLSLEEARDGEWNPDRLQGLDLVVVANAQQFNDDNLRALKGFVRGGGGLILFPGDRVTGRWRELFEEPRRGDTPLLPLRLENVVGDHNNRLRFDRLAAVDFGHPIFSIFRPAEGKEYLTTPKFFKRHRLVLNPGDRRCFSLAQFANREPAVVEGRFGRGTVIVAAFPVSGEWSTLPLVGADFVPLMLRTVSYARRKPELRTPSATTPGVDAAVAAADRLEDPACIARGPDGVRRTVAMARGSDAWVGKVDAADRGYYGVDLDARDPAPSRDERTDQKPPEDRRFHAEAGFAVNLPEQESDFTRLTGEELQAAIGPAATLVDLSTTSEGVAEALTQRREIWRWLMYVLAAVFVGEFFLATLRGPRTAAEAALEAEQGDWTARLTGVKEMTKAE